MQIGLQRRRRVLRLLGAVTVISYCRAPDAAGIALGADSLNHRPPSLNATCTSRISTGTSTSGPITAAKATGDASPKEAIATAIASSKLLPAAVKAIAVVRG